MTSSWQFQAVARGPAQGGAGRLVGGELGQQTLYQALAEDQLVAKLLGFGARGLELQCREVVVQQVPEELCVCGSQCELHNGLLGSRVVE